MTAIVTLTMNPALDKSTSTRQVIPEDKLRCADVTVEPGGGGVNVSRAIRKLGGDSLALYAAGGHTGHAYRELLQRDGLQEQRLPIEGNTRESFTVFEESSRLQYRFSMPGPTLSEAEWRNILDEIEQLSPDYLIASGSLPPGVPAAFYVQLARRLADRPTRVVVDTSGAALHALIAEDAPVFLVKPNLRELADLSGRDLPDDEAIVAVARAVLAESRIETLVVSLGAAGVLLMAADQTAYLRAPIVPIRSKIGAGDSTVAGIILALTRGFSLLEAVRFGVAAGAAAVMTPGTELCRRDDAERLYEQLLHDAVVTR